MERVRAQAVLTAILFLIWLLLSLPVQFSEVIVGAVVALIIAAVPLPGPAVYREIIPLPRRLGAGLIYVVVFLWAVVKSNIDVAFRVLAPRLPINPGIVRVKTRLTSRVGRLLLANSITLTPGTISVEIDGDDLFVHWISTDARDVEEATGKIVRGFERYLEVCFG